MSFRDFDLRHYEAAWRHQERTPHPREVRLPSTVWALRGSAAKVMSSNVFSRLGHYPADPTEYSKAIDAFLTESFEGKRVEITVALLSARQAQLRQEVRELRAGHSTLTAQVNRIEALIGSSDALPALPQVDWRSVQRQVAEAAADCGWHAEVVVDALARAVAVRVPASEEESLVDGTLDFYQSVASRIGREAFRAIDFDLDISDGG